MPPSNNVRQPSESFLKRIHDDSVALAMKMLPADRLGQQLTSIDDVKIGTYMHCLTTGETFRVLCNCASATPLHHTQRQAATRYHTLRYPTEDEIRVMLTPRVIAAPSSNAPTSPQAS